MNMYTLLPETIVSPSVTGRVQFLSRNFGSSFKGTAYFFSLDRLPTSDKPCTIHNTMTTPIGTRKTRHASETQSSNLPEAKREDDTFRPTDTGCISAEPTNQTYALTQKRLQKDAHGSGSHEVGDFWAEAERKWPAPLLYCTLLHSTALYCTLLHSTILTSS